MAKLDAIQLQIGLPLNIDQITGKNKVEGQCHIPSPSVITRNHRQNPLTWDNITEDEVIFTTIFGLIFASFTTKFG